MDEGRKNHKGWNIFEKNRNEVRILNTFFFAFVLCYFLCLLSWRVDCILQRTTIKKYFGLTRFNILELRLSKRE